MIPNILIVEDDKDLQEYLKEMLLDNGYQVKAVSDGITALKIIKKTQPDLIILDLGLPKMGGDSVCIEIKKNFPIIPVIILTAKDTVSDVVRGLNLGADDYVKKPFESDELLARIKVQLRNQGNKDSKLIIADLEIDNKTLEVRRGGKLIKLSPQEFKLLEYFINNKNRVLTREMILNRIWLYSVDIETRVVDVYIGYLRKKIDKNYRKKLIHSVRGFGYIIKE